MSSIGGYVGSIEMRGAVRRELEMKEVSCRGDVSLGML